jgi:hypothetical protein
VYILFIRSDLNGSDENKENLEVGRGEKVLKHPKVNQYDLLYFTKALILP